MILKIPVQSSSELVDGLTVQANLWALGGAVTIAHPDLILSFNSIFHHWPCTALWALIYLWGKCISLMCRHQERDVALGALFQWEMCFIIWICLISHLDFAYFGFQLLYSVKQLWQDRRTLFLRLFLDVRICKSESVFLLTFSSIN